MSNMRNLESLEINISKLSARSKILERLITYDILVQKIPGIRANFR